MSKCLVGAFLLALSITGSVHALEASHNNPLFVFPAPVPVANTTEAQATSILNAWNEMPEFFQSHAVMSVPFQSGETSLRLERLSATLESLKGRNVPLAITIGNGHTKEFFMFEAIGNLLSTYPDVKVLHIDKIQFDSDLDAGELSALATDPIGAWLDGILRTIADRDIKLVIELDGLNPLILMSHPRYQNLYQEMTKNAKQLVFTYAQGDYQTIAGNSALMGVWLDGAIDAWGVSLDSAAYAASGFAEPGQLGYRPGPGTMPPSLYRSWILNGAMAGASTYVFSQADELWAGIHSRYWAQVIEPTLIEITQRGYIARKDLVAREAATAYRLNTATNWSEFSANLVDLDPVFHEGALMQAAYNLQPGTIGPEWTPNTGQNFWIPILSPYATEDTLFAFKEVFTPGAVEGVMAWKERLAEHYPPAPPQSAFVHKVGRAIFVLHTRENRYEAQPYTIADAPSPLHDITATREGSNVTIAWPFREGDLSYSVHRVYDPVLETIQPGDFVEIASGIDIRTYVDENVAPGSTVAYSVTAVTNEQGTRSGVVDFGDYLIVSGVESHVDGFALVEPYTMRGRTVNGLTLPALAELPAPQSWSRVPEDTEEHIAKAYTGTERTLANVSVAIQSGSIDQALSEFTEDFSDTAGNTRQSLGTLLHALQSTHDIASVPFQVVEWDNNDFAFSGELIAQAYLRIVAQSRPNALRSTPLRSIPSVDSPPLRITFYEDFNGDWKIKQIEPGLIQLSDLLQH